MPADQLTTRERAVLLVLLAEGRELTNIQLHEVAGLRLDGEPRRRLTDRKLVTSRKIGRANAFSLTDDGAAACRAELTAERPPRAGSLGGALYAILHGLGRSGIPLADLFPFRPDVEDTLRSAYVRAAKPGEWLGLDRLRASLGEYDRGEVDAALERLAATPGVHLAAEPNRKALTDEQRSAAVRFGGDDRHMIMIESG